MNVYFNVPDTGPSSHQLMLEEEMNPGNKSFAHLYCSGVIFHTSFIFKENEKKVSTFSFLAQYSFYKNEITNKTL